MEEKPAQKFFLVQVLGLVAFQSEGCPLACESRWLLCWTAEQCRLLPAGAMDHLLAMDRPRLLWIGVNQYVIMMLP